MISISKKRRKKWNDNRQSCNTQAANKKPSTPFALHLTPPEDSIDGRANVNCLSKGFTWQILLIFTPFPGHPALFALGRWLWIKMDPKRRSSIPRRATGVRSRYGVVQSKPGHTRLLHLSINDPPSGRWFEHGTVTSTTMSPFQLVRFNGSFEVHVGRYLVIKPAGPEMNISTMSHSIPSLARSRSKQ